MGRPLRLCRLAICTKTAGPAGFVVGDDAKAVPNFDRLIRARFNNRDYGCHKQTHSACVRSGSVLTDLGAGPFQFDDGITQMELRKSRRVMFERGYDARLMAIDGTWHRACQIQDISETGAKLSVESSIEGLPLKEFFLVLSSTGTAFRRCELAWVNGDNLGVYFKRAGEKRSQKSAVTGPA